MRCAHLDGSAFFGDAAGNDPVRGDLACHPWPGSGIGVLTHSLRPRMCGRSYRTLAFAYFREPLNETLYGEETQYLEGHRLPLAERPALVAHGWYQKPYRMFSMKVTLLISFSVVNPSLTLSNADSRRKRMPSSRAARLISDVGFLSRIISRMRSLKSSNS